MIDWIKKHVRKFLFFIFGVGIVFAAAPLLLPDGKPIPTSLLLKTDKVNIIGSKQYVHKQKGRSDVTSVKYAYKTVLISDLPNEIVERRTKHSRIFTTTTTNTFITEIISGVPQYYEDEVGDWYQADYATTTLEAFNLQTKISLWKRLLSEPAFATVTTFFPDDSPETDTVDGEARHTYTDTNGVVWSTLVADAGSSAQDTADGSAAVQIRSDSVTDRWRQIHRGIYLFDTSSIGTDNIDSAILSIDSNAKTDNLSITPDLNIYSSAPASNTAVVAGDYDSLGTTAYSTAITFDNWSTTGYNDFTLNADGVSNIDKTGISKFGMRNANYDVADVAPTWASNDFSNFNCSFAERAGTSQDPKLTVTHSSDTCTAPTSGNWTVNLGDDCYVTSNTYIAGDLILIDNTGSGCLNIIDGVTLSVDSWEATSTRDYICLESDDGSAIEINKPRS